MCLLFFQLKDKLDSPNDFKVILVSVRDEFMARPTSPLSRWPESDIIGAQDLEPGREGGTWLAVNSKNGRIGILLNIKEANKDLNPHAMGRGKIVTDFLNDDNSDDYLQSLAMNVSSYNGFTFVGIDSKSCSASYVNNFTKPHIVKLKPGIYGFGNADDPGKPWKKVDYGRDKFAKIVTELSSTDCKDKLIERLFSLVSDETKLPHDERLWRQAYDWTEEQLEQLNALFVKIPSKKYGSRTWSIILIDGQGNGNVIERTRIPPIDCSNNDITSEWKETSFSFKCSPN